MKVTRTEKILIKKTSKKYKEIYKKFDELSWQTKNLYNLANYEVRKEFIKTSKEKEQGLRENANWLRAGDLYKMLKETEPFKAVGSKNANATLRMLERNWKSYFASIKDWSKHKEKYKGRPKMPGYLDKETGRCVVVIMNQSAYMKDGYIYFGWKPLRFANNTFKSIYPDARVFSSRIVPKGKDYVFECIHELEIQEKSVVPTRIAAIDLGVNNLMTVVTNCGVNPIVINGKPLKSMNQYYNKVNAEKQSDLMLKNGQYSCNKMRDFTSKRNRKIENYIHNASRMIVNWCVENNIDTVVCGYNSGWKQESDMGKVNNQKFIGIPYYTLVQKLQYKCENEGIKFITTEESYTSGTSFLDREKPDKKNYNKDRRVQRGLFVSNEGIEINADVNGAYQIMKKVFPDALKDGIEDVGLHPIILNIPNSLKNNQKNN